MSQTNIGDNPNLEDMLEDVDISAIGDNNEFTQEINKLRQELDEAKNEITFKESQLNSQRKLAKSMEIQNRTQSTRIARLEDTIRDLKEQI